MKPIETAASGFRQSLRDEPLSAMAERFKRVRAFTEKLCEPLEREDYVVQSMPETSPAKWHLAHTSWFFECFILKEYQRGYRSRFPEYAYLFNSYYNAAGPMHCRDRRGLITRPTVPETLDYRRCVDEAVLQLLAANGDGGTRHPLADLVELGLNHEQQHQELLLTDIKHLFAQNPLHPVYRRRSAKVAAGDLSGEWILFDEGVYRIGHGGDGFHYDNEAPRHRQFLEPFELSSRLVRNGDYKAFIEDDGYRRPELWLSLGWNTVRERGWAAPMYWEMRDGEWWNFTLGGFRRVEDGEPVCHVSFFEADAFARWAGARLATEAEWEVAAERCRLGDGGFVDNELYHPAAAGPGKGAGALRQMYGDVWEWTGSSYRPYPGYAPPDGALGEYNGKFMCDQMVLRGGSCATSREHIRPTYRNFFQPDKRWQFSGIRLARQAV